jgi:hypothetical protein
MKLYKGAVLISGARDGGTFRVLKCFTKSLSSKANQTGFLRFG